MLTQYGAIGLFLVASTLFALVVIALPSLLRRTGLVPHKPNPVKDDTYECGMPTVGRSWVQFNFRYYFYALMLIVFDVLVIFLYPWAVQVKALGWFGLGAVAVFMAILFTGYLYAWKKRVLQWQ